MPQHWVGRSRVLPSLALVVSSALVVAGGNVQPGIPDAAADAARLELSETDRQSVGRGAFLGYTSNRAGCGGYSTGPHVHFSLRKDGSHVNIRGHAIGGWTVREGSEPYEGCLVKDGVRRCTRGGKIYSDGSVGSH